ncbi:hypothetical protein V12B01_13750 [Vibrio splendidus 12B01]|nr:hypothetical protein V12B01_13750 [Vibrio splendidus 12B01]
MLDEEMLLQLAANDRFNICKSCFLPELLGNNSCCIDPTTIA